MQKRPKKSTKNTSQLQPDAATGYALAVTSGEIVAGPFVRAECQRHLRTLEEIKNPARGLTWDVTAAQRAITFFKDVLTVEVEETDDYGGIISRSVPFILQPWQCFIVGSLFGWKRADGLRRFRRFYGEIGKGNGKSPMGAGIGHYMLTALNKLRAECYCAATDRDQAAIPFRDAVAMYERSPALRERLRPSGINPVWQLTHLPSGSFFKPISSEKYGKSGIRPYFALVDEVHEHPDNTVIEMLRAGTKGNQEALLFEITNSGFDKKSICYQEHDYAAKVSEGSLENDAWFSYIAAIDEDDQPFDDESCWLKANPNLGVSIHLPFIREQVVEAKGMPSKEGFVRRLHFCEWTEAQNAAIPRHVWMACQGEVNGEELSTKLRPFGGLDLSRTRDLSAFTLSWLLDAKKDQWRFASKTWFWTPEDTIHERSKQDRAPYDLWAKQGYIEAVSGPRINYRWVADALAGLCAVYDPQLIGCDQYGLENLKEQLDDMGAKLPIIVHPQGYQRRILDKKDDACPIPNLDTDGAEGVALWMPDSINKLEAALLEGRIVIEPNPVLTMCAASIVYAQNRTGHRMFDKDKATNRIDGMVSLAMSIGVATIPMKKTVKSFWETMSPTS